MTIAATDAGAPYGPTPRHQSGATTEHAACRSPAQETSRAATTSPPCPSFASPAPPRSPRTTSARHRRSDPSGPHRSPAPQRGASNGLMRRLVRWRTIVSAAITICPVAVTSGCPLAATFWRAICCGDGRRWQERHFGRGQRGPDGADVRDARSRTSCTDALSGTSALRPQFSRPGRRD